MRLSKYFLPILKETPSEAKVASHILMLRAGMIRQQNSGIYYWLPLGLKILKKIESIVKKQLENSDGIELLMPCIQPSDIWKESGRYEAYGKEMLRITDRNENVMLFGPTNEEAITDIFRKNIFSYKDLPKNFFHIQWKFRDEIRPRFGIMRSREFLMKDSYSFDLNKEKAEETYKIMFETYLNIYRDLGLKAIPVKADTGAIGGDLSHEFHVMANTGESEIFFDKKFNEIIENNDFSYDKCTSIYAAADEMHIKENCDLSDDQLEKSRGIEVGHIFLFGTKYTEAMGVKVTDNNGKTIHPYCGSYGIGISRLVGAIIEANHDETGIVWPKSVSPFDVSLINLKPKNDECSKICDDLYKNLQESNIDVLYDDTNESTGAKFAIHDLLGFTWQIIVGPKLAMQNRLELKNRKTGERLELSPEEILLNIL